MPRNEHSYPFDDLPLFGGASEDETYAAYASGTAEIHEDHDGNWHVAGVVIDCHPTSGAWLPRFRTLPADHPLYGLIKTALEGPCAAKVENSIRDNNSGWEMVA